MLREAVCKYQQSILQSNLSYVETYARISRVVCALDWQFALNSALRHPNIVDTPLAARKLANRESGKQLDGLATARLRKGKAEYGLCSIQPLFTSDHTRSTLQD